MKATEAQPQDYSLAFETAANYFLRCMRARDFVEADELLLKKHGDVLHSHVTEWCFEKGITIRQKNGKLALSPVFMKPTAFIVIERNL
jgi:hypothetical protein